MPHFPDALGYVSGSTTVDCLTTAGVLQNVTLSAVAGTVAGVTGTIGAMTSTGVLTLSSAYIVQQVTAATTASDTIPAYGLVYFAPTTSAQTYTLPKPIPGVEVTYCNLTGTSNDTITLTGTTNTINNAYKTIVIPGPGQNITLLGVSTNTWIVKNVSSTSVGVSTSLPSYSS